VTLPRLSLTWKIFLGTATVVSAVLAGTLFLTSLSATRAADSAVRRGLDETRRLVATFLEGRERGLASGVLVFAQNPPFRSLVIEGRREDMLDQALEAAEQIGASWVQITDGRGVRLAKSDDPSAPAETLAGSSLIGGALAGELASGIGVSGDSLIYQAVAAPIAGAGATITGVLMATKMLDDSLAEAVQQATASDVVFYALGADGKPHIAASTLERGPALAAFVERHAREYARADEKGAADGGAPPPLAAVTLEGTHYVGQHAPLRSAGSTMLGGFFAFRSRDVEMAAFTTLRQTILLAGALSLVLAFLFAYVVAHQITRPVLSLVSATRRAADGDYSADIDVRGRDEIGALASAIRTMLTDLREKQALVEFLSAPGGKEVPHAGFPVAAPPAPGQTTDGTPLGIITPGRIFANRYEVEKVLGIGGMGVVYKAWDRELSEPVAIKTLKSELRLFDPSALERFKSELRLARRISHRNVVRTYDLGEVDGTYYITMEYVEGTSLKELLASRGRLPVPVTLSIGKQLCRALDVAHEQGVIHRDVKPPNLVIEPSGDLKVMDFGVARLVERTGGLTQTGMVVGTPAYMAPEQLLNDKVDARADIYATGVVIYECLAGRTPFLTDSPMVLISKLLESTPTPLRELNNEVPPPLADVVHRAISRDPDARPQRAEELHDLLAQIG
jgi:HAMP domain-containing protein